MSSRMMQCTPAKTLGLFKHLGPRRPAILLVIRCPWPPSHVDGYPNAGRVSGCDRSAKCGVQCHFLLHVDNMNLSRVTIHANMLGRMCSRRPRAFFPVPSYASGLPFPVVPHV
jgi:hypothetical protein